MGNAGHRLLFHWGFNTNPKNHAPLVKQVRKCLKGRPDSAVQERKFFDYLTNIQKRRNGQLIDAVTRVTSITTARGYANAIATILYDIHILDDYSTPNTQALPKIDYIERDFMTNGFQKLIKGGDKSERLAQIDTELKASIRVGRSMTNRKRAQNLKEAAKILNMEAIHIEAFNLIAADTDCIIFLITCPS